MGVIRIQHCINYVQPPSNFERMDTTLMRTMNNTNITHWHSTYLSSNLLVFTALGLMIQQVLPWCIAVLRLTFEPKKKLHSRCADIVESEPWHAFCVWSDDKKRKYIRGCYFIHKATISYFQVSSIECKKQTSRH